MLGQKMQISYNVRSIQKMPILLICEMELEYTNLMYDFKAKEVFPQNMRRCVYRHATHVSYRQAYG